MLNAIVPVFLRQIEKWLKINELLRKHKEL